MSLKTVAAIDRQPSLLKNLGLPRRKLRSTFLAKYLFLLTTQADNTSVPRTLLLSMIGLTWRANDDGVMTLDKGSDGELINDAEKIGVEATSLATEFVINVLKTIAGQGADDLDLAEPKDEPNYNQIDPDFSSNSPLRGAVEHSGPRLLDAGALPDVDFDTWLKAAKIAPGISRNFGDSERSKEAYN
ncbi:hypothetical protein C2857_004483 [Epichloe festucae Fl1]|uniref:Uncharacterized protein n=1 Tax=Epichloe festucae (strain Fl1) TaxID=877507 RepID=A0A7S9PVS4_EPIFF|nr:hypothetical protein C2857_004483 [Epichloe festucae Fl1]